uniref:Transmembrane protein 126A n=1 Tax=Strongyloides stercoralis TaxID=6248 RepID=A0A0K0EF68_STRER
MFDPSKYWEESLKVTDKKNNITKSFIEQNFDGTKSNLWVKLSMLPSKEQSNVLTRMINCWPVDKERIAFNWPKMGMLVTSASTATYVATKINSNFLLQTNKLSFLEALSRCSLIPVCMAAYSTAITAYIFHHTFIYNEVIQQKEQCPSCILAKCIGIGLFSGVFMPISSVPFLSYYILLNQNKKFPQTKNFIEMALLSIEGFKASRSILPYVMGIQVISCSIGAYALMWGRERIFNTLDSDDEFVESIVEKTKNVELIEDKVKNFFKKLPLVKDVLEAEGGRTKFE